jgi:hypothetical protein
MNRPFLRIGATQNNIDPAISDTAFQYCQEPDFPLPRRFRVETGGNEKIDIATPPGVVRTRPEERNRSVRSENLRRCTGNHLPLPFGQPHSPILFRNTDEIKGHGYDLEPTCVVNTLDPVVPVGANGRKLLGAIETLRAHALSQRVEIGEELVRRLLTIDL